MTAVGEILELSYGKALTASDRDGGDVPVVGSGGVVGGHSKGLTDAPTIVVGRKGSIGSVTWIDGSAWPIDTAYFVKAKREDLDRRWMYWMLRSLGMETMNKSAAVPGLNRDDVYRLEVDLPPFQEQRRIAAILDHADALRAKRRQVLDHLDSLTQSIFHDMFGDPVSNPKRWTKACVGDRLTLQQYGPRFHNESYTEEGVRIVRITDLSSSGILDYDAMPRLAVAFADRDKFGLRSGDILFARSGATVGKVALIRASDPECIAGAYFIRMRFTDDLEPVYVATMLRSRSVQAIVSAGSRQSAQQNFSGPGLRALPLTIPPIELQRAFGGSVEQIIARRTTIERALAADDELFASLQSRAFRGEL